MSYLCLSQSGFSVKKPKLKIYISVVHVLHCISIASCLTDILWKEILVCLFFLVGGGEVGGCVCLDVLFEFFWGEGVCFLCCFGFFFCYFCFVFWYVFRYVCYCGGGVRLGGRGGGLSLPELSRKVVRGIHVTVFKENYYISWSLKSWHCILVVLSVG